MSDPTIVLDDDELIKLLTIYQTRLKRIAENAATGDFETVPLPDGKTMYQALTELIEHRELIAFIAGCLQHGMAEEDTGIYIEAYKKWKEDKHENYSQTVTNKNRPS